MMTNMAYTICCFSLENDRFKVQQVGNIGSRVNLSA